nr:hypothetical protein BaRGS_026149 [Batillaria attramentaria]
MAAQDLISTAFVCVVCSKVCKNCRCPQEDHDLPSTEDADFRPISLLFDSTMTSTRDGKVDWMARMEKLSIKDPTGLAQMCSPQNDKVISRLISENMRSQKYISMLPEDKQEFASQLRRKQLQRQLPLHDLDPRFCTSLGEKEAPKYDKFMEKRRKKAAGIGQVGEVSSAGLVRCHTCKAPMEPGSPGVIADRLAGECWHPGCFSCCTCRQLLVDNIYFCRDGRIYCGRHYADQLYPRCSACDELIFAREYTQAEGRSWHVHHFCCWRCDTPLAGQRYIAKDDNPYCMACFEKHFSKYHRNDQRI